MFIFHKNQDPVNLSLVGNIIMSEVNNDNKVNYYIFFNFNERYNFVWKFTEQVECEKVYKNILKLKEFIEI